MENTTCAMCDGKGFVQVARVIFDPRSGEERPQWRYPAIVPCSRCARFT